MTAELSQTRSKSSQLEVKVVTKHSARSAVELKIRDMKEDKRISVEFSVYFALINTYSPPPPTDFHTRTEYQGTTLRQPFAYMWSPDQW